MIATPLTRALSRLSRLGIASQDRVTARFVMGTNHYLVLAIATAIPFLVAYVSYPAGAMLPAAAVEAAMVAVWAGCLWLNATGHPDAAAVVALLTPGAGFAAITYLLSVRAGTFLPLLMTPAIAFVIFRPHMVFWKAFFSLYGAGVTVWLFVDDRFGESGPWTGTSTLEWMLVANAALATVVIGSTAWLNAFYFDRERARADRRLHEARVLASTDSLTQLTNRRGMIGLLRELRSDSIYSLAIIDLDRFKAINDRLGHIEGDVVLGHVARELVVGLDGAGHVARWGGEEFLILMPGLGHDEAVEVMERARAHVGERPLDSDASTQVTFSCGVVAADAGYPWEIAVQLADALLYEAKAAGRNCVRSAQVEADAGSAYSI